MPFNLSETMVLLVYVFSRLIAENDHSQVHVVTGEVPKILNETLMLLNEMRFNVLDILSGRQSLHSSRYVSHKSSSASNALGHGKLFLKRSAN